MKAPNPRDGLDHGELTIEGNEDLSVRPWQGPSPFNPNPVTGTSESRSRESVHAFIVNDEDLTVLPWRQATAPPTGNEDPPGPIEPQAERAVSGHGSASKHLRSQTIEGVTVLTFAHPRIIQEPDIQELSTGFLNLVEDDTNLKLLIDFTDVQYISSGAVGKLINFKKKVSAVKGKLKLCCMPPDLIEAFRIMRLDHVFEIYENARSALDAF